MIKNIVFDMGKVLVDYSADYVCEYVVEDLLDRARVKAAVFDSQEWVFMDLGTMTDEQALSSICRRLPERLHETAAKCLEIWDQHNMITRRELEPVIRELKKRGYGIYLCSNASIRLLKIWQNVLPAAECFDGVLFSADIKYLKPQKDMYEIMFQRFGLKAEECYFIDDLPANIASAKTVGMDGYCFADQDLEKLQKHLLEFPALN